MAQIRINLASGEVTIEFKDTQDLEDQLQDIDIDRIESILERKKLSISSIEESKKTDVQNTSKIVKDLGTINLLKISEHGEDAMKLAVFLAASGISREEIKKITGVTILSS